MRYWYLNCDLVLLSNLYARSINLARFTFLDPGSLLLRNKSYWIHEGPSKSVQVSSCGNLYGVKLSTVNLVFKPLVSFGYLPPSQAQYWPDNGTLEYGPFLVELMSAEECGETIIRTFRLKHTDNRVRYTIGEPSKRNPVGHSENWLAIRKTGWTFGKPVDHSENWLAIRRTCWPFGKLVGDSENWLAIRKTGWPFGKLNAEHDHASQKDLELWVWFDS